MNILILTPDRVGSTLLQRLLTIYMLRKGFDKPVINLHELSNGLIKYYNSTVNREVLGKPRGVDWGYFQKLPEVVELLKSSDHYWTSRLAHYHLVNRKDDINDQLKFYEFLNKNCFIISCRRENIFEHALSWAINAHSKVLNVYTPKEKVENFYNLYKNGITITKENLISHLEKYKRYIEWSDTYFNVQSYFNYDTDVQNIENYILNLDFMTGGIDNKWNDMFNQSFEDWNACHRLLSNLPLHSDKADNEFTYYLNYPSQAKWDFSKGTDWPDSNIEFEKSTSVIPDIKTEILDLFKYTSVSVTTDQYNFLQQQYPAYKNTIEQIDTMVTNGFMVTSVPIKLQSLREKKEIIKNFDEAINWYNEWVNLNQFGQPYTADELTLLENVEEKRLTIPIARSISQNKLTKLN